MAEDRGVSDLSAALRRIADEMVAAAHVEAPMRECPCADCRDASIVRDAAALLFRPNVADALFFLGEDYR